MANVREYCILGKLAIPFSHLYSWPPPFLGAHQGNAKCVCWWLWLWSLPALAFGFSQNDHFLSKTEVLPHTPLFIIFSEFLGKTRSCWSFLNVLLGSPKWIITPKWGKHMLSRDQSVTSLWINAYNLFFRLLYVSRAGSAYVFWTTYEFYPLRINLRWKK